MRSTVSQLYRTKLVLSCLVLVVLGVLAMVASNAVEHRQDSTWLRLLPLNEFGGILIGAGLLSVWLEHFLQNEQQAINDLRLRQLLHEQAPAMRDAVLEAFAANHEDLARVATPEMLDQLISNSLALRLGDAQFASEIYTDIRDQAIGATERWHHASLSIELAPLAVGRGPAKHFTVTVRWEYITTPQHSERRFVCVSNREEYAELAQERDSTSAWYLKPSSDVDASSLEAFELLRFAVDGAERPIRRAVRKSGQVYTANVGSQAVDAVEPVTISYTYRTVTSQQGHLLFFDIEQPTRDLRVSFDYSDCGVASVSTLDLIPSVRPTRIELPPVHDHSSDVVRADIDGWIFPRSGVAFVWTLDREAGRTPRAAA